MRGEQCPTIDLALRQSSFGDEATPSGKTGDDDETRGEISAAWKLFSPIKNRYDVESERAELNSIEEAIAELEKDIRFQLKRAVKEHRLAMGKLLVAEKGIAQAKENCRITENQLRQQLATTTDILDAGTALSRAKNDYKNARYDLQAAIARIEIMTEGFSI
ncbi:MAG: TolC family protein [bacterium]|nr:TolC family protein [bacterium]